MISKHSKIMALDYGSVRIGVAISDFLWMLAHPFTVIQNDKNINSILKKIIQENNVSLIIIGFPLNLKGEKTKKTLEVEKFANDVISNLKVEFKFWDERLTTKQAQNYNLILNKSKKEKEKKGNLDKIAATILLQSFLESLK